MPPHTRDSVLEGLLAPTPGPRAKAGTSSASTQRFPAGSLLDASRHGPPSDRPLWSSSSLAAASGSDYDDEAGSEAESAQSLNSQDAVANTADPRKEKQLALTDKPLGRHCHVSADTHSDPVPQRKVGALDSQPGEHASKKQKLHSDDNDAGNWGNLAEELEEEETRGILHTAASLAPQTREKPLTGETFPCGFCGRVLSKDSPAAYKGERGGSWACLRCGRACKSYECQDLGIPECMTKYNGLDLAWRIEFDRGRDKLDDDGVLVAVLRPEKEVSSINYWGLELYLEKLFIEEAEIVRKFSQDFAAWIAANQGLPVASVPSLEPNLAPVQGVLLETCQADKLRQAEIFFFFCKVHAGNRNVTTEICMNRNEALRPAQAEQTFVWINNAVAKSRTPALQTKDLRKKALTLESMTESISKYKKDLKAQHESLLAGNAQRGTPSSTLGLQDDSASMHTPRLSVPSFVAGAVSAKPASLRRQREPVPKSTLASTPPVIPPRHISATGRPVVDRSRSREPRAAMAALAGTGEIGAPQTSPAKRSSSAADRVSVFANDASYKQISLRNVFFGEQLGTRLNGVIHSIFFTIVFLCHWIPLELLLVLRLFIRLPLALRLLLLPRLLLCNCYYYYHYYYYCCYNN